MFEVPFLSVLKSVLGVNLLFFFKKMSFTQLFFYFHVIQTHLYLKGFTFARETETSH